MEVVDLSFCFISELVLRLIEVKSVVVELFRFFFFSVCESNVSERNSSFWNDVVSIISIENIL